MRVIICGGGTAGHIYPGIALADELRSKGDVDLLFIGPQKGVDREILAQTDYPLQTLDIQGLPRQASIKLLKALFLVVKSIFQARRILGEFKPHIVVGMGGYGSFPVMAMATLLRIPTLIHEQNVLPGLANKLLGRVAQVVAVSFPGTEKIFSKGKKTVLTGNPLRQGLFKPSREEGVSFFGLHPNKKTLLVFGGSRGAQNINRALIQAYPLFQDLDDLQIIHLTGRENFQAVLENIQSLKNPKDKVVYRSYPYLEHIGLAYAVSDLILARAGATSIAEITARGIPAILVPYPYAVGAHQEKNARFLEEKGAAAVVLDRDLAGESLFTMVTSLIFNTEVLMGMKKNSHKLGRPEAAKELAHQVKTLVT